MTLADRHSIALGPLRLDLERRSLSRDGKTVVTGGRSLDVLIALARADGRTVSKNTLLHDVWPGMAVEENNLAVHISALRKLIGERWIVTVPGHGYRLETSSADPSPPERMDHGGRPSIAVLPFADFSEDGALGYFAHAMVDDIITALCRIRWLVVAPRSSSFAYKDRTASAKQIGIGLRVRYMLAGSVRHDRGRLRVTVQLINAEDDDHIWAERFERVLTDAFAIQDELTEAIVQAVGPAIAESERQRVVRKGAADLSAWEAYQMGRWHLFGGSADGFRRGLEYFRRALEIDPYFAQARAMVAQAHLTQATLGGSVPLVEGLALCEAEARATLQLDPGNPVAFAQLARVLDNRGDPLTALQQVDRAIALHPSEPAGHMTRGHILVFARRPEEGRASLRAALRRDPLGETAPQVESQLTMSYYLEREYAAAEAQARHVIHAYPDMPRTYPFLAASLAQLGRMDEAAIALHEGMAAAPGYFSLLMSARPPWYREDDYQHVLNGLHKAGWRG